MAAIQRPARSRPIRLFLIIMLAVPLVSLLGLWAFAASITVPNAISDHNYNVNSVAVTGPDIAALTIQLPTEQHETYLWLLSGRRATKSALLATRQAIDKVLPGAESALLVGAGQLSASSMADLNALEADLRHIGDIRQSADAGTTTPAAAFQAYSGIIDAQFRLYYAETLDRGTSMQAMGIGATDAARALEMVSREATLVDGALTVSQGQMDAPARQLFSSSATSRQLLMDQALSLLKPSLRAGYVTLVNSAVYRQFQGMESQIAASAGSGPVPVNAKAWTLASGAVLSAMLSAEASLSTQSAAISNSASRWLFTQAIVAGGVGLFAVAVSVFLLIWFGRKFTGDLTRLYTSVRGMAEERLPRVVERLRRGDDVDVSAESPPPDTSSIQEISQIARSFGTVQEAAVAAAVEQARLRKGVSQVFLNISMRNQSLLHRQLSMLDSMERRTGEPGALADLFRLDHLTTRMRRHAEGLIILSGATPGRGWREPVPVVDVLRAAVAEVEDYVRVDVLSETRDLLAGNAVNDVIHLVAELVENATVFSPPNTRIEVRAERVGTGLVAEIEDRGLGLSQDELADINHRLANPPEFDLANSEELGLFVVSRLAARHAIKVSLRQSAYGGTTAIVVLPFGVVVREDEVGSPAGQEDGRTAGGREPDGALPPPAAASGSPLSSTGPLPRFGATGRHRLTAAATGRRAGTDTSSRDEDDRSPEPRPLPGAPWEHKPQEPAIPAPASAEQPQWDTETGRSWFDAFSRPSSSRPPGSRPSGGRTPERPGDDAPAPAPAPEPRPVQQAGGVASPGSHLGMPVRVPQASLAPQLRAQRENGQQATVSAAPDIDARSPEATRNMLTLMQHGWQRGRIDDLDAPADNSDNETER
jgi:signal transduction histidine kinase